MSTLASVFAGAATAGSLSSEPVVGVAMDYATNPLLRATNAGSERHGALMLDLPLRLDYENVRFALLPRARISDSRGYSSLASNYTYVNLNAQFIGERGYLEFQAGGGRDSSLYYAGELSNGVGVRRDSTSMGLDWARNLTERGQVQLDLGWSRVRYDQGGARSNLVDYRYFSASPTFSTNLTERTTVRLVGSAGRYRSLNGRSHSDDQSLELGVDGRLDELWKISASAGYSKSTNRFDYYFLNFFLGTFATSQKGAVYNATLQRHGERTDVAAVISRQVKPSGFAYSSRLDTADLSANFTKSERWSFNARAALKRSLDPGFGANSISRQYYEAQVEATWHWSPDWTLTARATRVSQRYTLDLNLPAAAGAVPNVNQASNGAYLELNHQFSRLEF